MPWISAGASSSYIHHSDINTCVQSSGPGPASELWHGLFGQVGAAESYLRASWDPWGHLGIQSGGMGPKDGHQSELGQIRNRIGKSLFQQSPPALSASCLLPPISHLPCATVIFLNCDFIVVTPLIKQWDHFAAHGERTKTHRLISKALKELTTMALHPALPLHLLFLQWLSPLFPNISPTVLYLLGTFSCSPLPPPPSISKSYPALPHLTQVFSSSWSLPGSGQYGRTFLFGAH